MLHRLLDLGGTGLEFLFYGVIIKGIVAHWMAHAIVRLAKPRLMRTERQIAIWRHYQFRAQKMGHEPKSVVACQDGKCSLFA